jgi:hypothetical protein
LRPGPRSNRERARVETTQITPTLADYYIVQEPTTKRCRIFEERPAPGVGVMIGGVGFGVRTEAETRMRTYAEKPPEAAGIPSFRSVNVRWNVRRDDRLAPPASNPFAF